MTTCPHRERRQPLDPATGQPNGPMVCMACGEPAAPKIDGSGRCNACGAVEGARAYVVLTPGGGQLSVTRCPRCAPRPMNLATPPKERM